MTDIQTDLAELLSEVDRPGSFYAAGSLDLHIPRLAVAGVGPIALPLLPAQAEQIAAVAEQAPYGRGSETLVDTQVRNCRQVDAARVSVGGRGWEADLARILEQVTAGLCVTGTVRAEPYKLLLYGEGGFFVPHRDTEKAPGMFGTLVIVLPSDFQGGELLISHKGETAALALHPDDPAQACFAAFYADCRHEVRPVTAGHRLALIYNLIRDGGGELPQAPDYHRQRARVAALLRDWPEALDKLVYPLEHAYSEAELGFAALKGADAAVAEVMLSAADAARCDCHLALLTIEEYGWGQQVGRWRDEAYEIGEVTEADWRLHDFRLADGTRLDLGHLAFTEQEVSPLEALDDLADAEAEFSEATGNAGVSFERRYQRAALVIWPRADRARILSEAGLGVSLPYLSALVLAWEGADGASRDALHQQALELATRIRQQWPSDQYRRDRASKEGHTRRLLDALERLGNLDQRLVFLADNMLGGAYGATDNPNLVALLAQLPAERAGSLLETLVDANAGRVPAACAQLLRLCTEHPGLAAPLAAPAAKALLAHFPGADAKARDPADAALVADSLTALERIDGGLAEHALQRILASPAVFPMDARLLPAALTLRQQAEGPEPASHAGLRRAVLAHLAQRIAMPLAPPADWARPAEVACSCGRCAELKRFLAAPDMPRWGLKANQQQRDHVADQIQRHRCDLDLTTERRGSPHTLWCNKNQASYLRRVEQRKQDLEHRALLAD